MKDEEEEDSILEYNKNHFNQIFYDSVLSVVN